MCGLMRKFQMACITIAAWAFLLLFAGCRDSSEVLADEDRAPGLRLMMPYRMTNDEFIGARIQMDGTGRESQQVPLIIAVSKAREDASALILSSVMQAEDGEAGLGHRFMLNADGKIAFRDLESSDLVVMTVRDGVTSARLFRRKGKRIPGNLVEGALIQEIVKLYHTLGDAEKIQILPAECK